MYSKKKKQSTSYKDIQVSLACLIFKSSLLCYSLCCAFSSGHLFVQPQPNSTIQMCKTMSWTWVKDDTGLKATESDGIYLWAHPYLHPLSLQEA